MANNVRIPKQSRSKKTKEKIIEAALFLFSNEGYHKTNTALIAQQANISTGSIYMYYKNKKEIFLDVYVLYFTEISKEVYSDEFLYKLQQLPNNLKVKIFLEKLYNSHLENIKFHKEVISLMYLDDDIYEKHQQLKKIIIDKLTSLLTDINESLKISNIRLSANLIYIISEEIIHSLVLGNNKEKKNEYLKELETMLIGYLFK